MPGCLLSLKQAIKISPNMADLSVQDVFGGQEFLSKLIEDLDTVYPQYLPQPEDTIAKIMYKSGQRSVIEYLIELNKENV